MTTFDEYISETYRDDLLEELSDDDIDDKIDKLKKLLDWQSYCVIYTGAGISTASGIPDYRGPKGIWTKRRNGDRTWVDMRNKLYDNDIRPSNTHNIIYDLINSGKVKSVISTNVDGLHVMSGLSRFVPSEQYTLDNKGNLIELHGNKYVEECRNCNREYYKNKPVDIESSNHTTGNKCGVCGDLLFNNILHFGETYLDVPSFEFQYDMAFIEMCRADLVIAIGSSLLVPSACDLVDYTVNRGGKLVIINKQATPKDSMAELVIHGDCEEIFSNFV